MCHARGLSFIPSMEKITEESVAQPCCALQRRGGVSRGVSLNWYLCRGESELKAAWSQGQPHMKAGKGNIHQGARKGCREKACLQGHPELLVGGSTVSWEPWRQHSRKSFSSVGKTSQAPKLCPVSTFQMDLERDGNRPARGYLFIPLQGLRH